MNISEPTIKIEGIYGLSAALKDFQPHLVISIADPHSDVAMQADALLHDAGIPSVRLRFHDNHYGVHSPVMVQPSMLEEAAEAVKAHAPDDGARILVHCHAGTQRSPALAIFALGCLYARSKEIDEATAAKIIDTVFTAAPHAEPNERALMIASDLLDIPGWFHAAISNRRKAAALKQRKANAKAHPLAKKRKRAFRV